MDSKAFDNKVAGEWFAHLSGQPVKAFAQIKDSRLHIVSETDDLLLVAQLAHISIAPRVGSITRTISLSDGGSFATDDNDGIDRLFSGQPVQKQAWIHGLEEFRPRLVGLMFAVILLGFAIYRYAIPVLVEIAVYVTPPVATEMMAAGTLETLDRIAFSQSALPSEYQQKIRTEFAKLAEHSGLGVDKYKLNFRQGGFIGPNAFALPDGNLILTDELIELANGDDELILGVLAHEIGHVEKEHSLRQIYRAAGVTGLIFLIGGDIGAGAQDALVQGAGLLTLSYSREAEAEADRISVELMRKSGKDPTAIGRFFELIEKEFGDSSETSIFSTHPGTPERVKAVEDYAESLK